MVRLGPYEQRFDNEELLVSMELSLLALGSAVFATVTPSCTDAMSAIAHDSPAQSASARAIPKGYMLSHALARALSRLSASLCTRQLLVQAARGWALEKNLAF